VLAPFHPLKNGVAPLEIRVGPFWHQLVSTPSGLVCISQWPVLIWGAIQVATIGYLRVWLFWVDETKVICLRRTLRKRSESRDRLRAVFLFVLQARLSNLRNSLAVETPWQPWPGSTRVRLNRASSRLAGL
jgi:hypothetical protein